MNSKSLLAVCAKASIALLVLVESASASFIDLNDFTKDLSVTVAVDGSSAVMAEDSALSTVLLANNPRSGRSEHHFSSAWTGAGFRLCVRRTRARQPR